MGISPEIISHKILVKFLCPERALSRAFAFESALRLWGHGYPFHKQLLLRRNACIGIFPLDVDEMPASTL